MGKKNMMGMMGMGMSMMNAPMMSSPMMSQRMMSQRMMGLMKIQEDKKPSLMMALKDALADGKLTMMERMELKKQYPMAEASGKLDMQVMMALEKINKVQSPVVMARPMKPSLMKAIKEALSDGKLTMMERMELKMQFPMAAESGKLDNKIMMIAEKKELMGVLMDAEKSDTPIMMMMMMREISEGTKILQSKEGTEADRKFAATNAFRKKVGLPPITREKFEADAAADAERKARRAMRTMMQNMGIKMAIKDALADGKLTMMEKMELKKEFPKAAKSGQLDKKIMMVQMMLEPIKMDAKPVPMMATGIMMAIKDALADGKLTMMEKMELKMQFPLAAESGKLEKKVMMALKKINEVQQPAKKAKPMKPSLMKAIEKALDDGKLTMMELKKLEMMYPMAAESGKLDQKIMMAQMMLDPIKDKKAVEPNPPMMKMGLNMAIKDALSDGKLTMMEKMELKMQFPMAAESGKLDQKIDKFTDKTSMDLKTDTSDSKDNNQTVKDADSSDSSENKGKDKDGKDKIIDGKDRGGGKIIFDGRIDSGVNKGDKGPHHGLPKIDYDASIDNYKPERLDFVKKDGTFKKPKLKRKDYSADTFRSEAFKSELDSRGLTGDRRGGTVTHFKDSTGTLKKIPTDASGIPKALTSDGKGGFKDLGGPPTLSTERDLFGDLDETRQSKLATIKSIVDNPQPGATKMAISMRKSKGLSILMDAGFTQTRTRMKPLLMTPASNSRSTRLNIRL